MNNFKILVFFLLCLIQYSYATTFKICATEKVASTYTCQLLQKGNSQVECIRVIDSVDCALKLSTGDVDFGVFNAEEALVASKFINEDVSVIGQVKHRSKINDSFAFESVVVVKKNFTGEFSELRGSKYCHPGFNTNQYWTDRVLKEFERKVVPHACTSWVPQVRVEMYSLGDFFGDSCRPGPWTPEQPFDEKLKKDYSKLCKICDNPHPTVCSYNSQDSGTHKEALDCLTQKNADVTYVALNYVQEYFGLGEYKNREYHKANAFSSDYQFLCPNETVQSLEIEKPCAWIKQPWNVILARKANNIAGTLQQLLPKWLPEFQFRKELFTWQTILYKIIQKQDGDMTFVSMDPMSSLTEYIQRGREIPSDKQGDPCRRPVAWCTVGYTEYNKCQWLKYASLTHGISPEIKCVKVESKQDCLQLITEEKVDIVGIDTDLGYAARQAPYNTSAIMYQDSTSNGNYKIMAVIKDGPTSSSMKNFQSLKSKKVCFPQYQSLAWVSFLQVTKIFLPKKIGYTKAVASFLGGACLPGLKSYNTTEPDSLCYVCKADECTNQASENSYKGDIGALSCLSSGAGDVAFINYKNLLNPDGQIILDNNKANSFRIICKNGSLSEKSGFDVDDDCLLSTGIGAEIVARKSRWSRDIIQLLLKIDDWFGAFASNFEGVIHVYEKFQNKRDLLFQDTTVSLVTTDDPNYDYVNSYKSILNLELRSSSSKINIRHGLITLCISYVLYYIH